MAPQPRLTGGTIAVQHDNWQCPKCNCTQFETSKIRVEGGRSVGFVWLSAHVYHTVTCSSCGYTEFYRATSGSR